VSTVDLERSQFQRVEEKIFEQGMCVYGVEVDGWQDAHDHTNRYAESKGDGLRALEATPHIPAAPAGMQTRKII
jgi:hypothetical protein